MGNQDDFGSLASDINNINQIKWAMRHGQKIDGLDQMMLSNQPIILAENHMDNILEKSNSPSEHVVHNAILEEQIDKLERSINQEILSLKSEFTIVAHNTALEEQMDKLGQSVNEEILSLKNELQMLAQGRVVEEQIAQLGQVLNEQIISWKGELATGVQDGGLAKGIDHLEEVLHIEIRALANEIAMLAQNKAVEGAFDKMCQSLQQELLLLKSEVAIIGEGKVLEEQISNFGKYINQDILSLRNEFSIFVQTQLNQEKTWKIAEMDWKHSLKERENKLTADIQEVQQRIMGKFDEHLQCINEQLQRNDTMLRQEVSLLTSKLAALQQFANKEEEEGLAQQWQEKMEEQQHRLVDDISYIQYVVEEIATHPHNLEAQQKLRENFFIREITTLKQEMASICQKCKSWEPGGSVLDSQQNNKRVRTPEINVASEEQVPVDKKRRKRR